MYAVILKQFAIVSVISLSVGVMVLTLIPLNLSGTFCFFAGSVTYSVVWFILFGTGGQWQMKLN